MTLTKAASIPREGRNSNAACEAQVQTIRFTGVVNSREESTAQTEPTQMRQRIGQRGSPGQYDLYGGHARSLRATQRTGQVSFQLEKGCSLVDTHFFQEHFGRIMGSPRSTSPSDRSVKGYLSLVVVDGMSDRVPGLFVPPPLPSGYSFGELGVAWGIL